MFIAISVSNTINMIDIFRNINILMVMVPVPHGLKYYFYNPSRSPFPIKAAILYFSTQLRFVTNRWRLYEFKTRNGLLLSYTIASKIFENPF